MKTPPFLQLAAYAQAKNGSVPAFSFAQHGSSIVTYTARRAYQLADRFRRRGIPVVMGRSR